MATKDDIFSAIKDKGHLSDFTAEKLTNILKELHDTKLINNFNIKELKTDRDRLISVEITNCNGEKIPMDFLIDSKSSSLKLQNTAVL